jgi:hypothetical protein
MQEPTIEMQAKLFAALSKAQGEMGAAYKTHKGQVPGNQAYKYADIGSVEEAIGTALVDNGLFIAQFPGAFNGESIELSTIIGHAEGGSMSFVMQMPCAKKDAQGIGSAITYARRYALTAALRIVTEDDDGKGAMPTPQNRAPQEPQFTSSSATLSTPSPGQRVEVATQPGLSTLTGNQIRALISNTKFPSSGIVGAYLKNDGALGPIIDAQVEAWSSDNEGADGMALLRAAAGYAIGSLDGEISKRAKAWLSENQS